MDVLSWLLIGLFFAFMAGMFVVIMFGISIAGGWSELAQYYRCRGKFVGQRKRFQNLFVDSARYGRVAVVGVGKDGLYLATMPPFQLFHPPLLIPWNDATMEWKETRFFRSRYLEIRARLTPWHPIVVHSKSLARLLVESASRQAEKSPGPSPAVLP
jgi:hypothetical protein